MKRRIVNILLAACLTAGLAVGSIPAAGMEVRAADISSTVTQKLAIHESVVNQLLTKDLKLPTTVDGLEGATIEYSVADKDAEYVAIEDSTLKIIKRPKANEEDYKFKLKATVTAGSDTAVKEFPLTIRAGLAEDDYAGYVYVCFSVPKGKGYDVQQIHFFLSEDGMNWTALNGCKPIFETGTDYQDNIERCAPNSVNYKVAEGTNIKSTTKGDASVLFPFEGRDQGVRDPYLIRGCKKDGSDSNKVWLLATDLNTHAATYGSASNMANNVCGDWGAMSTVGKGSQKLFVWETEDWVHWERRYIDVGGQINSAMAWAPEAIYNPEKDNYLVYWSGRIDGDGASRNRLYCNETSDFKTFGPTRLYEQEPFYANYGANGVGSNSGYGNIDTSQLWVAGENAQGKESPYGTLFRLVKDETNNHVELQSAKTVLDPSKDYQATLPTTITPYEKDGVTYSTKADLSKITNDTNGIKRADIVYNWYKNQSVGNHFEKISQKDMEKYKAGYENGNYEGATMFKFIDRDEWCVMIDNYGSMKIRYEPYITSDLSEPDSIQKAAKGTYGRTGDDVGTHGGMIPITVEEYNTLIDTYNADPGIDNYHKINYVSLDTRVYDDRADALADTAARSQEHSAGVKAQMKATAEQIKTAAQTMETLQNPVTEQRSAKTWTDARSDLYKLLARADKLLANKTKALPEEMKAEAVYLEEEEMTLCTKAADGLKPTAKLVAEADLDSETSKITYASSNANVAAVDPKTGVVTAKSQGSAEITATVPGGAKAVCKVTVKGIPNKVTVKKKSVSLKAKKTFQIKASVPKGTTCSKFKYKSNKPKIASVSADGKITAKKKGTAKITVTASSNSKVKATITVKVK